MSDFDHRLNEFEDVLRLKYEDVNITKNNTHYIFYYTNVVKYERLKQFDRFRKNLRIRITTVEKALAKGVAPKLLQQIL